MSTDVALTGPRWSSAVLCARMAAYQGLGVEGEPHPEAVERRFARGRRIGRAMADEIIATLSAQGRVAIAEAEVPWPKDDPIGVGHVDVLLVEENHPIEVVSTEGCALPPNKPKQVAGYAINLGAEKATVVSVDPKTGQERTYPINVEAFRSEVEDIQTAVAVALDGGPLPERFDGAHPYAYPCMDCPFRVGCHHDYSPPPAGRLPGMEEDVLRLADIERQAQNTKKLAAELESERDEIRARLAPLMEPGVDYIENGVKIRRSQVAGRKSLSFAALEAAGYVLPEGVAEFVTEGAPHDRWTVRELEAR